MKKYLLFGKMRLDPLLQQVIKEPDWCDDARMVWFDLMLYWNTNSANTVRRITWNDRRKKLQLMGHNGKPGMALGNEGLNEAYIQWLLEKHLLGAKDEMEDTKPTGE